ncbi:MAG TPA: hypothetical protein VMH82_14255 [Myxococcota bacterium]|nr:hypothetical protein [Myxococcota bacterium]
MASRARVVALAAACLLVAAAASCPLQTVQISKPRGGLLDDDPTLAVDVKVGRNFVSTSATVRVDGIDLIAALGLTPPFAGASGSVTIGGSPVSVTEFAYAIPSTSDPIALTATLAGLPPGDHFLEAEALPQGGGAATLRAVQFALVEPFTREADVLASSGTPPPSPVTLGSRAGDATLGEPLAAPPIPLAAGDTLRSGFVPVARGRASAP